MTEVEQNIGYEFKNKELLQQALTHSSYSHDLHKNYERLEFLGDRVLGLAMAQLLYKGFPEEPEGSLSPRHTRLVCKETVAKVALELKLDKYIRAENKNLCRNQNVLCDVAEAVIGAICIDSGMDEAVSFVDRHWEHFVNYASLPQRDSKSQLQEIAHKLKLGNLSYIMMAKQGTEHRPVFYVLAKLDNFGSAEGMGQNKKEAEQAAAGILLQQIQEKYEHK